MAKGERRKRWGRIINHDAWWDDDKIRHPIGTLVEIVSETPQFYELRSSPGGPLWCCMKFCVGLVEEVADV